MEHLILLSRTYPLPSGALARVDLLQHTHTLRKTWEVSVSVRTTKGVRLGSVTRKKTRTDAMRLVRRWLYAV